jgi:hypothetical protein
MNTSPKAPLPSFYNISKSYSFISLLFFKDIFYFRVNMDSFFENKDYFEMRFLGLANSTGGD